MIVLEMPRNRSLHYDSRYLTATTSDTGHDHVPDTRRPRQQYRWAAATNDEKASDADDIHHDERSTATQYVLADENGQSFSLSLDEEGRVFLQRPNGAVMLADELTIVDITYPVERAADDFWEIIGLSEDDLPELAGPDHVIHGKWQRGAS